MRPKVYSLKVIKQAIIDLGWCSDQIAEFALERALDDAKNELMQEMFGTWSNWKKKPLLWNGKKYDCILDFCKEQKISRPLAHYYIKPTPEGFKRKFRGSKIEYA